MNVEQVLRYLEQQGLAIEALVQQLDEVQVAFNAQFDEFHARHNAVLDRVASQVAARMEALNPALRAAIDEQTAVEEGRIAERRTKVRDLYLPQREEAAEALLQKAQAELTGLQTLNPELNDQEEGLKRQKAELEARLDALNQEIRRQSRGLGVVWHFAALTRTDRERQRILGKLELINQALYKVRHEWESRRETIKAQQAEHQERWQLESIAVARLQSELGQLEDPPVCAELALRRAIRDVLDRLKEPAPSPDPELDVGLREMAELNRQTDAYHEGLAAVGGMIGLAGGIGSGLQAIRKSIEGLKQEQAMHSEHLQPLEFSLPPEVESFHRQWPVLAERFSDEQVIGRHPVDFCAAVEPLVQGPLSQPTIEAMFQALGAMLEQATTQW